MNRIEIIRADWDALKRTQCHGDSCDRCYYLQLELARQMKEIAPGEPALIPCEKINSLPSQPQVPS
jgi:hypothetical protein